MTTWVALLRAVNLGPNNKIAMADFRALLEHLGYDDVLTLAVSGNAVFTSPARAAATIEKAIESALAKDLKLNVRAIVRSSAQLAKVVKETPFANAPAREVHVGFCKGAPHQPGLDPKTYAPDELALGTNVVYLRLPNGQSGSRLPDLEKLLGIPITRRTWNVVTKLNAMARD